ncbi:hypothetical protein [Nocardiopsis alba]|uniref:recombination directionality factor n=1 Tax=Nocardiopsis alba TaxID=53437 RepID=UPI003D75458E
MALRIFETDPDSAPKERKFTNDVVGRFRSGRMVGKFPESLEHWRVTTGDPVVADALSKMLGGHPEEWETGGEDGIEILTNSRKVSIIIDQPTEDRPAISAKMILWGANGVKIHECDGIEFLDDERRGQPCGCPALLADRKAAAKAGHGPKPEVSVRFRLFDDPDLGEFRFRSSSWDLVKDLHNIENDLEDAHDDGPARATLSLELVEFVPKGGPMKGRQVSYRKPVIKVHGAIKPDADEDEDVPF